MCNTFIQVSWPASPVPLRSGREIKGAQRLCDARTFEFEVSEIGTAAIGFAGVYALDSAVDDVEFDHQVVTQVQGAERVGIVGRHVWVGSLLGQRVARHSATICAGACGCAAS